MSRLDISIGKYTLELVSDSSRDLKILCGTILVSLVLVLFFTRDTNSGAFKNTETRDLDNLRSHNQAEESSHSVSLPKVAAFALVGGFAILAVVGFIF